jgi:hypothetical protein
MVDHRVPQVFKGEMAQAVEGVVDGLLPLPDPFQELFQIGLIHGVPLRDSVMRWQYSMTGRKGKPDVACLGG